MVIDGFKKKWELFNPRGFPPKSSTIDDVGAWKRKPAEKRSSKRDSHVLVICIPHMK